MRKALPLIDDLLKKAVAHYWRTLNQQSEKQKSGDADRGGRAAVTGGKQMDGFCELVQKILVYNQLPEASIYTRDRLELPGYFRPTKRWDMLVVHDGHLIAAIEFKSQLGPSFGNNFNNRTEEALGSAVDLWTAYREGAFGREQPRPWLGWVMLLEESPQSMAPVGLKEPHFKAFAEFRGTSYTARYELLLRRLILEKTYDCAALILATASGGPKGRFREPASDLTMKRLIAGLAGHVLTYVSGQ
ncbi:MAG TPA: PaeR7I family type II restriction endonuclease [Candidatus Binataceae bacterium]|nr:PaeR7I family type II restriction endonuclease [Candidatus Binataceae bacterium]